MEIEENERAVHWGPRIGMPPPKSLTFVEALDKAREYAKDLHGVTRIMIIRALMDGMNAGYRGEVPEPPNWEEFRTN